MFVLTIDSDNNDEILSILKDIIDQKITDFTLGSTGIHQSKWVEMSGFPAQPWVSMSKFLRFDATGNAFSLLEE